jgi:hypothetical protein
MDMEQTIEQLTQRITDLERRFRPIEYVLYRSEFEPLIEEAKGVELNSKGKDYIVTVSFETDKGNYTKEFEQKAYTQKQAEFLCERDIVHTNLQILKKAGKIRWYKILSKTSKLK